MTSRLKLASKAVRPALPARAVFSGPPGAGKTRTALIVATVLADGGDILFIDTEQESALTYADDFAFTHLPFRPPYDPRDLAATLVEAGDQYAVIIVDSLTHFWRAEGGVLDIAGGKFSNWKDARPVHETMVQAFLACKAHFIGCARSKVEHVQETDPRSGKQVVRKVGMAVVQDDSLEYELNVACELDMDHSFVVSKSRTVAVPVGRVYKPEQAEQFAEDYRDWLKGGEPPAPAEFVESIRARIAAMPDAVRKECKAAFVASLGRPDTLPESRMAAADALVARFEAEGPNPDGPPSGQGPGPEPGLPPVSSGGGTSAEVPSEREPQAQEPASSPDDGTGEEAGATALSGAVTPWKDTDPDAWGRWNRRCQAKATKVLAEDSDVRDAQRHGLAWQASSKLRGAGVESWNELTEPEAAAVEDALEQLKAGAAFMVADGDRWSCGLGTPPVDAELVDEDPLDLLARAVADAGWTQAKATRRARAIAEELGLQKLPTQWDTLPRFPRVLAALAAELAEEAA